MNFYCPKCLKITKNNKFGTYIINTKKLVFILTALTIILKDLQLLMRKKVNEKLNKELNKQET